MFSSSARQGGTDTTAERAIATRGRPVPGLTKVRSTRANRVRFGGSEWLSSDRGAEDESEQSGWSGRLGRAGAADAGGVGPGGLGGGLGGLAGGVGGGGGFGCAAG